MLSEHEYIVATTNFLIRNVRRDVLFHHSKNEGVRTRAAVGLAKAMGQRTGWLDWVLMWDGPIMPKIAFVELKTLDDRISTDQEVFIAQIHDIGIPHRIVHMDEGNMDASIERFLRALVALGVPFKKDAPCLGRNGPK